MTLQDHQILNMLKNNEQQGFDELFKRYYKPLVVFGNKYMQDSLATEDIVQEVFVKFWNKKLFLTLKSERISTFLFSMVRNQCINELKKKDVLLDAIDIATLNIAEKEILTLSTRELDKIHESIELLPEQTRKVIECILLQNMKYKEAAEELGVSVNTVKTLLKIGITKLRDSLFNVKEMNTALLVFLEVGCLWIK